MKKHYLIILLLLPLAIAAQKNVDLDRYHFTVQYRSLPKMRLNSEYRTYNVEMESTKLMQGFFTEMDPEKSVLLQGWRKLPAYGHIERDLKRRPSG